MKKDECFFFKEVQDMQARIPSCSYDKKLGCVCNPYCKHYISKVTAYELIKSIVDKRNNSADGIMR